MLTSARGLTSAFFFFNDTATTEIYTLSLHDALPIYLIQDGGTALKYGIGVGRVGFTWAGMTSVVARSAEHTSELQSPPNLVCRLLLEKRPRSRPRTPPSSRTHSRCTSPRR